MRSSNVFPTRFDVTLQTRIEVMDEELQNFIQRSNWFVCFVQSVQCFRPSSPSLRHLTGVTVTFSALILRADLRSPVATSIQRPTEVAFSSPWLPDFLSLADEELETKSAVETETSYFVFQMELPMRSDESIQRSAETLL